MRRKSDADPRKRNPGPQRPDRTAEPLGHPNWFEAESGKDRSKTERYWYEGKKCPEEHPGSRKNRANATTRCKPVAMGSGTLPLAQRRNRNDSAPRFKQKLKGESGDRTGRPEPKKGDRYIKRNDARTAELKSENDENRIKNGKEATVRI